MPVTLDPRLEEIAAREERERQEQVATAEALATPAEPAPDLTLEPTDAQEQNVEQVTEPEPAPLDNRLYIDPARGHYQELTRLEQEDAAIRNAIRTRVGREAAKSYKPKIAELEHQLNELRSENTRLKTSGLDEDEIKERLLRDPEFRRQYDSAATPGPDPRAIAWFESAFSETVEEAEKYLPREVIGRYVQALQGQWYDYDRNAEGKPVSPTPLTREESMRRFQLDLNRASIQYVRQAQAAVPSAPAPVAQAAAPAPVANPTEPAPAPVSKPNQALASSSPDLTPNSVHRAAGAMSVSDYRDLDTPTAMKLFPEGMQSALDSGKLFRD